MKEKKKKDYIQLYYLKLHKKSLLYRIIIILILFLILILVIKFSKYKTKINHIHISMSFNNNYTYIIMVSITSILINSKKSTFIHFHIIIGNDVEKENIEKIISLKNIKSNSNFKFYNIGNIFQGWKHGKKKITVAAFYRTILGEIIKNLNKIIYLDGDTLIYDDLSEMYNLNMHNLYFRGIREIVGKRFQKYMDTSKYICDGVMLINLKLLKKYHVFSDIKNYYLKYFKKNIYFGDQHIINALFKNRIGFLPPKFGMWYINAKTIKKYQKLNPLIYSEEELKESINKPVIRHMWGKIAGNIHAKPWLFKGKSKIKKQWNYYAKKTGYYFYICKYYKYACININS